MPTQLEKDFHSAMEEIYRRIKKEAGYDAILFRRMLAEHGGPKTARKLINSRTVSDGYVALWERGRLDLTVEAQVLETPRFHGLFAREQLEICRRRLSESGYAVDRVQIGEPQLDEFPEQLQIDQVETGPSMLVIGIALVVLTAILVAALRFFTD